MTAWRKLRSGRRAAGRLVHRFRDSGVVVTGAAQGLGLGIADAFLGEGARVVLADVNEALVERVAAERDVDHPGRAVGVRCDVTDSADVQSLVDVALEGVGRIDVLVNNAGVITANPCVNLTEQEWDLVMDVSAKGVFLGTRATLAHMLERGSGSIVNVSSEAAKRPTPGISHYCAAKAAVIGFTSSVALEVAPAVRVNAVCPGTVETPMMDANVEHEVASTGAEPEAVLEALLSEYPMGRFQRPADVANVVLFLCSDAASQMTGQAINVTGGRVQS